MRAGKLRLRFGVVRQAFLAGVLGVSMTASAHATPELDWVTAFPFALERAGIEDRVVMVDFYTGWCHWCRVLDKQTYADPRVVEKARGLVCAKVNAEVDVKSAARYQVQSYPTILFLNPDGSVRKAVKGFLPPERFLPILNEVMDTSAEAQGIARMVEKDPSDPGTRAAYAEALALGGRLDLAVAQVDTLLLLPSASAESRRGYELDRLVWLGRNGDSNGAREGIERWLKAAGDHPRRVEAEFQLATLEEAEGERKSARKRYERIVKVRPGSWLAAESRERASALK